jgi:hypothetical protein
LKFRTLRLAGVTMLMLPVGLCSTLAFGQGTVNFSLNATGISTRVYMPEMDYSFWPKYGNTSDQIPPGTQTYSGELLSGAWAAQLWAAPGADRPENELVPASAINWGAWAGTFPGSIETLDGIPTDIPVATLQMRVWPAGYGSWWVALFASHYGSVLGGKSLPFNVYAIGGGTNPAPNLINLRSFSLIANLLDGPVKPLIYVQPQSRSAAVGSNVDLTVEVASPTSLAYQWRLNGSNISGGGWTRSSSSFFEGATNVLHLTNVQPADAGLYSISVLNHCCPTNFYPVETLTAVSSKAVLVVGNPGALTLRSELLPQLVLDWDGAFFLQATTNVAGPFSDLSGPVVFAPYTNTDSSGFMFFRLRN